MVLVAVACALWLAVLLNRAPYPKLGSVADLAVYERVLIGRRLLFAAAVGATLLATTAGILTIARWPDRDLWLMRNPACSEAGEHLTLWQLDPQTNRWSCADLTPGGRP